MILLNFVLENHLDEGKEHMYHMSSIWTDLALF